MTTDASMPAQRRSWWSRHWKWLVPTAVLLPLLSCTGAITVLFVTVFGTLKGSEPFRYSLAEVRGNAAVQAELGTPIEPGFMVWGSLGFKSSAGGGATRSVDLHYRATGPRGSANIYVIGTKSSGAWSYSVLLAKIEATGRQIKLQQTSP